MAFKEELLEQNQSGVSSTVLSNANIIEDVIPDLNNRLETLSPTKPERSFEDFQKDEDENKIFLDNLAKFNLQHGRTPNDATGIVKLEGGAMDTSGAFDTEGRVFGGMAGASTPADDNDRTQQELLDQMKASLDSQTKMLVESIQKQFNLRRQQQAEIDRRALEGINQSLLVGGSSRYAPLSSTGIVRAKETASLMALAELDAEEQRLITNARIAKEQGDFKIMEKELERAETKRKEKHAEAKKLADKIAEENKKLKERMIQASRESAIADLFAQGITDSATIIDMLNFYEDGTSTGGEFTLKEVGDALKILKPDEKLANVSADLTTFKQFFPDVDVTKPEGRKQYLSWLNEVAAAKRDGEQKTTEAERVTEAVSNYASVFIPGAEYNGINVIGDDGFMDPQVWKAAIADAPNEGLSRKQFIEQFGYLINRKNDKTITEYGLTPAELKLIGVEG